MKKKWKHFDAMYFLAEKNNPKKTYGNVPLPVSSPSSSSETGIHSRSITPEVPSTSSGKRKRSVSKYLGEWLAIQNLLRVVDFKQVIYFIV